MTEAERIAADLTPLQCSILDRLAAGRSLGCATRMDDRARQELRRAGLIEFSGKPKRWKLKPLGEAVRHHLEKRDG